MCENILECYFKVKKTFENCKNITKMLLCLYNFLNQAKHTYLFAINGDRNNGHMSGNIDKIFQIDDEDDRG